MCACAQKGVGQEKLAFTMLAENLKPLLEMAQILAGFGVLTVLLAIAKRNFERRRWRNFKRRVNRRMDDLRDSEIDHPRDFEDQQWKAECERMLNDSGFSPLEINLLLDTSVIVAKGIASDRFFL